MEKCPERWCDLPKITINPDLLVCKSEYFLLSDCLRQLSHFFHTQHTHSLGVISAARGWLILGLHREIIQSPHVYLFLLLQYYPGGYQPTQEKDVWSGHATNQELQETISWNKGTKSITTKKKNPRNARIKGDQRDPDLPKRTFHAELSLETSKGKWKEGKIIGREKRIPALGNFLRPTVL